MISNLHFIRIFKAIYKFIWANHFLNAFVDEILGKTRLFDKFILLDSVLVSAFGFIP
jgi:hypothetical protein